MNSKRFSFTLCAVFAVIVIAAIGIVVKGNSYLKAKANAIKEMKLTSYQLDEQRDAYQRAKKDVEQYNSLNKVITAAIPDDKEQAQIYFELNTMAKQVNITLESVSFPSSTLGNAPVGVAETPKAAADAAATAAATAAAPDASGAASAKNIPQTQVVPVKDRTGADLVGVGAIKTEVSPAANNTAKITYEQLHDFLSLIESNQRIMQIVDLHITPLVDASGKASITFTLTLNVFTKMKAAVASE